jgi:glycosyltransferase involved in cell wall biosynthesis
MTKGDPKTICFIHYGIGWRDGINTVIKSLAIRIQKQRPDLGLCFLGGQMKEKILENAFYQEIPELLPKENDLTKEAIKKEAKAIAKKIAQATKGMEVIVIENPLMGDYHLPAMLGFSIYASQYKPVGTKVFFRIHDLYTDSPHYYRNLKKLFFETEIKNIIQGKGVDGFLIINRKLKEKLAALGVPQEKIFYLPNGVDSEIFNTNLTKEESGLVRERLGISDKKAKLLLYPVRVVPRKNIEEAILLTYFIRQLTKDNYILMISGKVDKCDPLSEGYYQVLKEVAELANFPVIFNRNSHLDPFPLKREYDSSGRIERFSIADIYQVAEAIVMTSLREGFGYPFLECWFTQKMVIGRRIEQVISDFKKNGLDFNWLYDSFLLEENNSNSLKDEQSFERAKKVIRILENKQIEKQVLDLNREAIMNQIKVLEDKEQQKQIIRGNLETAQKIYEISAIAKRFLELVG